MMVAVFAPLTPPWPLAWARRWLMDHSRPPRPSLYGYHTDGSVVAVIKYGMTDSARFWLPLFTQHEQAALWKTCAHVEFLIVLFFQIIKPRFLYKSLYVLVYLVVSNRIVGFPQLVFLLLLIAYCCRYALVRNSNPVQVFVFRIWQESTNGFWPPVPNYI